MSKKVNVDKEAVRVLAIELGAREAARRLGLKEATVCAWSSRYKWKLPTRNQHAVIVAAGVDPYKSIKDGSVGVADAKAKAKELLLADFKECEARTKNGLARATARAADEASALEHVLPRTQQMQQLATAASRVFGWDQPAQTHNTFNTLVVTQAQLEQIRALRGT
jgi:hypothetical protein